MPHPQFPNLTVLGHPLIQHKLTILRDKSTTTRDFKQLVNEIAMLMAYEVTQDLPLEPFDVETPLERMRGVRVAGKKLALVPILRAGLGMVEGIAQLIPSARVGHIGIYREHDTLEPVDYYFKIPSGEDARDFFVLDPMLATGGSAADAVSALKHAGAQRIRFLCLVAAPEGVRRMLETHPDVPVFAAALDRELNDRGYILPGLGDAGDRLFGSRCGTSRTTCGPAFPASIGSWPAAGARSPRPSRPRPPRSTAPAFTKPGPRWIAPSASVWCSRSAASRPRSSRSPATTPRCTGAGPRASVAPLRCCGWATRRPPRPGSTSIAARSPTSPAAWPGPSWPPGIRCFGHSWRENPREPAVRRSAARLYAGRHTVARPGGRTPPRPGAALRGGAVRDRGTRPRHAPRPARATERRWALVGAGGALGHRLSVCLGSGDRPGPQRARAPDAADAARRGPHRRRDRRRPRPRRRASGARR